MISILYFCYKVIWLIDRRKIFRKIAAKGFEIDLFPEKESSYFDRYIDEIDGLQLFILLMPDDSYTWVDWSKIEEVN